MAIYLDFAATTPVCPQAAMAAMAAMTEGFGNPSSGYPLGTAAAVQREAHRGVLAAALGCAPQELFFTSCGTEGNNWAITAALELNRRVGKHIITTAIEHAAVLEPLKALTRQGYEVTFLRPDKAGRIDPAALAAALRPDTALVSMMLVNNELGTLLPVREAAGAIRDARSTALLHVDAVQGFLKVSFTPKDLGADFLTVSGHKVMAPKGIGALYIRRELHKKVKPLFLGGGQEGGLRPGTEPTAQIAAFAAAVAAHAPSDIQATRAAKEAAAHLLAGLPGVELVSEGDAPHILALSLVGYPSQPVVRALGDRGICVSAGSACHRGKPSHVFAALGLPPKVLMGMLRVSFSPSSTPEEGQALAQALADIQQTLVGR